MAYVLFLLAATVLESRSVAAQSKPQESGYLSTVKCLSFHFLDHLFLVMGT